MVMKDTKAGGRDLSRGHQGEDHGRRAGRGDQAARRDLLGDAPAQHAVGRVHAPHRPDQAEAGELEGLQLPGDPRPQRKLTGSRSSDPNSFTHRVPGSLARGNPLRCARSRNASPGMELSEQIQKRLAGKPEEARGENESSSRRRRRRRADYRRDRADDFEYRADQGSGRAAEHRARDRAEKERAHGLSEYAERRAGCTAEQDRAGRGRCEQAAARRRGAAAECTAAFQFGTRARSANSATERVGAGYAAECTWHTAERASVGDTDDAIPKRPGHAARPACERVRLPRSSRRRRRRQRNLPRPRSLRPHSRRVRAAAV